MDSREVSEDQAEEAEEYPPRAVAGTDVTDVAARLREDTSAADL